MGCRRPGTQQTPDQALTSLLMAMLHMHSVAASRISSCSSNMYPSIMGTAFSFRIFCLQQGKCERFQPRAAHPWDGQAGARPPPAPMPSPAPLLLPQPLADASQVGQCHQPLEVLQACALKAQKTHQGPDHLVDLWRAVQGSNPEQGTRTVPVQLGVQGRALSPA